MLATYLHVVPMLRTDGVLPLFPLYVYMVRRGTTSTFTLSAVLKFNHEPRQTGTTIVISVALEH